jgi:hypothetical protein
MKAWYNDKKFLTGIIVSTVLAVIGWTYFGSSNSAGQITNNQGIVTQGQSGGNNTVINQRPNRALDDQGKRSLLSFLPDKNKPVKLMVLVGDPERDTFGNQVAEFLKLEGYQVREPIQRFIAVGDTPSGTVIDPSSEPDVVIIKVGLNNR